MNKSHLIIVVLRSSIRQVTDAIHI